MNERNHISRRRGGGGSLMRWIAAFALAWLALAIIQRTLGDDRVELSYTEFKSQTREGTITSATFEGSEIRGEFAEPFARAREGDTTAYDAYRSYKPPLEDEDLLDTLEARGVEVSAVSADDAQWIWYLLLMGLPGILLIGYFVYMGKKIKEGQQGGGMFGGKGGFFGMGKSKAKRVEASDEETTFDDVAGQKAAKQDLREIVAYLKTPERFKKLGANIPKGVLLTGAPGTGKTLLAKAVAGEADVPFFSIGGSEFIEMFVGVGASRVRDLFANAKKEAPSVIFVDELDSIGRRRGAGLGGGHDEREQTLNQILNEMDGFSPNESVVVLAATNRPDVLDKALTRPGRFDRRIALTLPEREARTKALEIHTRNVTIADDVDLENVAARCVGFSGADLRNLVNEAALFAGRRRRDAVTAEDFDDARDKILLGSERDEKLDERESELVAWHEAGHALLAKSLPNADPLQKASIVPRGQSLGATEQTPERDRHYYPKPYLEDKLTLLMGGRASERLKFDEISNGAAMDLKQATSLARKMVCQWGMSDKLGAVYFAVGEDHVFLGHEIAQEKDHSDETARVIDEEIKRLLDEAWGRATRTLEENRTKLDALAEALLERETMVGDEIDWLLDKVEKGE
ncbi:MAG: ATP-dependent zinc metalloprotease FtsH [Ignavibacteriales bacterium]|nr:ATP-dependent zinc metalloprotease FtsH [Ignavibacteriales bacterium]